MKKICMLFFVIFTLLVSGCGCSDVEEMSEQNTSELDSRITEELERHDWEYSSTDTTYESTYKSEYWNFLDNRYEKLLYEAAVNADFSDKMQKFIYLFYDDEADEYSWQMNLKAIEFARLDHPELELMNMGCGSGSCSITNEEEYLYQSVYYYSREYNEYLEKLNEVNTEIADLVEEVNNTEDSVEKHLLIFDWITTNVKYVIPEAFVGTIQVENDGYILARMETDSVQNIYGAIVNKEAVCDGIADAYKYICNLCNLECIVVSGYISDLSEEKYHAWNLVKVNDTWYLVDATWDLEKERSEYFMVKDLNKGERTPFNIGYDLPGYDNADFNEITFHEFLETNELITEKGLVFSLLDENHVMYAYGDTIYTSLSSLGLERYLKGQEISRDVVIKTNAKITTVEYYNSEESLLEVVVEKDNLSDIVFFENIEGNYVDSMYVYLLFEGNTYQIKLQKGGA